MKVKLKFRNGKTLEIKHVVKTFEGDTLTIITLEDNREKVEFNTKEIRFMHVFKEW